MIALPSGATTIAPMIDATGVLEQPERGDERGQGQEHGEPLERSPKRSSLGEEGVELGGAGQVRGIC